MQPDFQWQKQLRHERDITAQLEAVSALERFPTADAKKALMDMIEEEKCFYKVRCAACHSLTKVIRFCFLRGWRLKYFWPFGISFLLHVAWKLWLLRRLPYPIRAEKLKTSENRKRASEGPQVTKGQVRFFFASFEILTLFLTEIDIPTIYSAVNQ